MTLLAAVRGSPWFSAVGFSLIVCSWLRAHWQASPSGLRLSYLSLLLVMLIRLPLNLDLTLATWLQSITSRASSFLLDAFGVTHYLRGNVVELPGGTLFVEEACSGVQSLFTVLFLVCLWIVWQRRVVVATPAYVMAGVIWALIMNIVRITSISLAQEWHGTDLSEGTAHEILGWICLSGAVLMMLSTDRLLQVIFYPVPPDESGHLGNPVSRLWNQCLLVGAAEDYQSDGVASPRKTVSTRSTDGLSREVRSPAVMLISLAVLLCLPSLALGYRVLMTRFSNVIATQEKPLLWDPGESLLKHTGFARQVTEHDSLRNANSKQLGNHADVWTVVIDGTAVRIAVSQPYPEWHDMRLCYSGNGWQVNDWNPTLEKLDESGFLPELDGVSEAALTDLERWPVSYAELVRETGEFGTLLFCGITQDRQTLSPPMSGLYNLLDDRMKDRGALRPNIIMLQLWTVTQKPLIPEQLRTLRELFETFRLTVLDRLSISVGADSLPKNLTMLHSGDSRK